MLKTQGNNIFIYIFFFFTHGHHMGAAQNNSDWKTGSKCHRRPRTNRLNCTFKSRGSMLRGQGREKKSKLGAFFLRATINQTTFLPLFFSFFFWSTCRVVCKVPGRRSGVWFAVALIFFSWVTVDAMGSEAWQSWTSNFSWVYNLRTSDSAHQQHSWPVLTVVRRRRRRGTKGGDV